MVETPVEDEESDTSVTQEKADISSLGSGCDHQSHPHQDQVVGEVGDHFPLTNIDSETPPACNKSECVFLNRLYHTSRVGAVYVRQGVTHDFHVRTYVRMMTIFGIVLSDAVAVLHRRGSARGVYLFWRTYAYERSSGTLTTVCVCVCVCAI